MSATTPVHPARASSHACCAALTMPKSVLSSRRTADGPCQRSSARGPGRRPESPWHFSSIGTCGTPETLTHAQASGLPTGTPPHVLARAVHVVRRPHTRSPSSADAPPFCPAPGPAIRQEYDAGDGQVCQRGVLGTSSRGRRSGAEGSSEFSFLEPRRSGRGGRNVAVGNSLFPWHGLQIPRYTFGMPLDTRSANEQHGCGLGVVPPWFFTYLKGIFGSPAPVAGGRAFVSTPMVAGVVGPTLRRLAGIHASDKLGPLGRSH